MKRIYSSTLLATIVGLGVVGGAPQGVLAGDEVRAAAVLQIPFASGSSFFDVSTIRVGVTAQYADVEDDEITIDRQVTQVYVDGDYRSESVTGETFAIDEGNQVYGAEVNVFLQPFGGWTPSVELLGFYGSNDVQGAFGGGYDLTNSWFLDAKVMFPYSEVGVRFIAPFEVYVGAKTFGSFDPDSNVTVKQTTTTNYTRTPEPEPVVVQEEPAPAPAPAPVVDDGGDDDGGDDVGDGDGAYED